MAYLTSKQMMALRTFSFFSLILLYPFTVVSQSDYVKTIFPGAQWKVQQGQGMGSFGFTELVIDCDTAIFRDKSYYIVKSLTAEAANFSNLGYVREDTLEQKVYFISKGEEEKEELLIIDYALEKGDSFYLHNGWGWQVVDTVRNIDFATDVLNRQSRFIDFGPMVQDGFIEGIGLFSSGPVLLCEGWTYLTDYNLTDLDCSLVTNISDIPVVDFFQISPNPAYQDVIVRWRSSIPLSDLVLQIRSITGQVLQTIPSITNNQQIELNGLPKGMLIFQVLKDGQVIGLEKIVHHE